MLSAEFDVAGVSSTLSTRTEIPENPNALMKSVSLSRIARGAFGASPVRDLSMASAGAEMSTELPSSFLERALITDAIILLRLSQRLDAQMTLFVVQALFRSCSASFVEIFSIHLRN